MKTKAFNRNVWNKTRYFDLQKNWRKVGPVFKSESARNIWHPCIEEYMFFRAEENGYKYKPDPNAECPAEYESCDWAYSEPRKGPKPKYWDYARHAACHWLVDLALFVAMKCYPKTPWRILTHDDHSTVWNGSVEDPVLFDINYKAIGVSSFEAMKRASAGRELKPGKYLKRYLHGKQIAGVK